MSVLTTVAPSVVTQLTTAPSASPGQFQSFTVIDASHDDTPGTVFSGGALRVNYTIGAGTTATAMAAKSTTGTGSSPTPAPTSTLDHVTIEAWQPGFSATNTTAYSYSGVVAMVKVADLQTFNATNVTDGLVNLLNTNNLAGGTTTIQATAYFKDGSKVVSAGVTMQVKTGSTVTGSFKAETFDISQMTGDGLVIQGNGGTDRLILNLSDSSQIASIDGMSPAGFSPTAGGQAIYQGVAVDYVRLISGREIYFTGFENLQVQASPPPNTTFSGSGNPSQMPQTINLVIRPTDEIFRKQWNLQVTDVPDAWRFTTGSNQVLLVSLDTGVLPTAKDGGQINGIDPSRLITDPSDDDNGKGVPGQTYGHGHMSISVMIATANDGDSLSITGINWVSNVFVNDVYHGVDLQKAIRDAFAFADARGLNVVFQGGIQGESWLNDGGSQEDLERLIASHANSLFVIAAGNGGEAGPNGGVLFPDFQTTVSGVAKLETTHSNVMSVGALERSSAFVDGMSNAAAVNLAFYSNRGSNLTMVAPTDSFADNFTGFTIFPGTSCANPNLAAMASLVWSINPKLSGAQVRYILEQTAMDLGAAGRDNTFGSGLVNAGLAVRRAVALTRDYDLAMLPQFTLANPPPAAATTAVSAPIAAVAAAVTATNLPASSTTASPAPSVSTQTLAAANFSDRQMLMDAMPADPARKTILQDTVKVQAARTSLFAELAQTSSHGNVPTKQDQGLLGVNWI